MRLRDRRKRSCVQAGQVRQHSGYLSRGTLTAHCNIHYMVPGSHVADQLRKSIPVVPPPEVGSCVEHLLKEGRFSDVVVAAGGQEFPAHRVVLAQRSDVFGAMFDADMKEKLSGRVVIEDLSADVVDNLVTFIYTDSAPDIWELAAELLMAAEKYNIARLKAVCELHLALSLNLDNVVDLLVLADLHDAGQLRRSTLDFIVRRAADMMEKPCWEILWNEHPRHMKVVCEKLATYVKRISNH